MGDEVFTIAGYCSEKRMYIPYAEMTFFDDAVNEAKMLGMSCRRESLTKLGGEDIDWIEILIGWNTPSQKVVWGSYDMCILSCANV